MEHVGWRRRAGARHEAAARAARPTSFCLAAERLCGPPGRGDFSFGEFSHAPSPKNLSKNGSAHKGGSLCVKEVLQKSFLVPKDIPLAARSRWSETLY